MKQVAVIDIGSNSIRYMIARRTKSGVCFSDKLRSTTRLASGLLTDGYLKAEPMLQSVQSIAYFCSLAAKENCPVFAYATSAVRDAKNRDEFLSLLESLNLPISVISGSDEGRFAYIAACKDGGSLIDIGGGSTQLVTRDNSVSFPIGCVRAKEYCQGIDDFDACKHRLFNWFSTVYKTDFPLPSPVVGVGGTITTLGALLQDQKEYSSSMFDGFFFSQSELALLLRHLFDMGENRKHHPLLQKRHDVIIPGGMIVLYLMQAYELPSLSPSDIDGIEGFALSKLEL